MKTLCTLLTADREAAGVTCSAPGRVPGGQTVDTGGTALDIGTPDSRGVRQDEVAGGQVTAGHHHLTHQGTALDVVDGGGLLGHGGEEEDVIVERRRLLLFKDGGHYFGQKEAVTVKRRRLLLWS